MNARDLVVVRGGNRFGLGNPKLAVSGLRALADAIETGRVSLLRVETSEKAGAESFPASALMIEYAELRTSEVN